MRISDWSSDVCSSDLAEFREDDWSPAGEAWQESRGWSGDDDGDAAERMVQTDSLQDHLSWQLHLTQMSDRDHRIGLMLIDAIDDDGYLRESLDVIAQSLLPEIQCSADEVLYVLHQVQRLDPRSEEQTSELQSLMRISYAVFCLKKKNKTQNKKYE